MILNIMGLLLKYDGFFELFLGFALVFLGSVVLDRFRSGKNAPPLLRVVFCTAFTYGVSVIREMIQFFLDYYNEDSALQDYNYVPDEDMLFFKLFGQGSAQAGQYHVMDTDLDFLCMMLGCALGGGLLLILAERKEKKKAKKAMENERKAESLSV